MVYANMLQIIFVVFITISGSVICFEGEENLQYLNLQEAQKNIHTKIDELNVMTSADIKSSLNNLKQDYIKNENWPSVNTRKFGPASAVAFDKNNVVVFQRYDRIWNSESFDAQTNIFKQIFLGPIKENTVIAYDHKTGQIVEEWGNNLFYMPHGLSITENHYFLTDVAMHQVFRFDKLKSDKIPTLVLGEKFKPGIGNRFCKPTSTAALDNGDFFVADGYCNSRIIKFNYDGEKINEWGRSSFSGISSFIAPPGSFAIPHALTLVKDKNLICAADRENGRIQCFSAENGKFDSQYHSPIIGDRIFSVACSNNKLYVVNGPEFREDVIEVKGYIIEMSTGNVVSKFGNFTDPHDITVSDDGNEVFVADLTADGFGNYVQKFTLNGQKTLKPTTTEDRLITSNNLKKPTGRTTVLVFSIVLFFAVVALCFAILISRRKRENPDKNLEYHSLMTK